jgi:uncharacterized protein
MESQSPEMKINVAQIREDEGLTIHHSYGEGDPSLGDETRLLGHTELDARLAREGDTVEVEGELSATVEFDCDRCLAPVKVPISQHFDLTYVPPIGTGDERALGDADLSIGFYREDVIDIDDLVREQIELALPMTRLCSDDCRGLCPDCGINLNEGRCACSEPHGDPRWSALKDMKF